MQTLTTYNLAAQRRMAKAHKNPQFQKFPSFFPAQTGSIFAFSRVAKLGLRAASPSTRPAEEALLRYGALKCAVGELGLGTDTHTHTHTAVPQSWCMPAGQ
jgi:hypothetical protein